MVDRVRQSAGSATSALRLIFELIRERAEVSLRSFDRMFRRALAVSTGQYYRRLRLTQARSLAMKTSIPTHEIATCTGFGFAATLTRAFKVQLSSTMTELRRAARA